MSGIAGIAHSDGRQVDLALLREMTRWLAFRGPNGQRVWADGSVGFGHAALQTAHHARWERQPASLREQIWIVSDARLDAREELADALHSRSRNISSATPDSQILLHAYAAWGEACVDHILGDFAFAIWDGQKKKLFCACDPLGIKTLFYAALPGAFLFSNTLDCVRLHPEVSDRLNDAAIADFLLFGLDCGEASTSFAEIHRLPAAHTLVWSRAGLELRNYWQPPVDGCIRYKRRQEYIEHFRDLLERAVHDRLTPDRAGILLSGGLDSSSLAAVASELREKHLPALELHAFTTILHRFGKDLDAPAARTVAAALRIPFHTWPLDDADPFAAWDEVRWPEPVEDPFAAGIFALYRNVAEHAPVLLSGEGADNLMEFEMAPHVRTLWRERRIGRIAADIFGHAIQRFRAPDGLRGPLRRFGRFFSPVEMQQPFPAWIDQDLAENLNLKKRWENPPVGKPPRVHPLHPKAYASLFLPQWRFMFAHENPGVTHQPVEVRYPFLDLRLLNFLLAIPAMPWFFRKQLLRDAMRNRLPETIRLRPKTPLQIDPVQSAFEQGAFRGAPIEQPEDELSRYVNLRELSISSPTEDLEQILRRLRPISLNFWLRLRKKNGYKMCVETEYAKAAPTTS
jgi:asparagine synthase (glutamine-hydrolysing)